MKTLSFIAALKHHLLICCLTILSLQSYALIPNNIYSSMSVIGSDNCIGDCTIHPYGSLTIASGSTVTFYGNITIQPNGSLYIVDGGTVLVYGNLTGMSQSLLELDNGKLKMGADNRIILRGGPVMGAFLKMDNNSLISNAKPPLFWSGIEIMRGPNPSDKESVVYVGTASGSSSTPVSTNTIEYAEIAIRNYDKDYAISSTSGGMIRSDFTIFKNNKRALALYNELRGQPITDPTNNTSGANPFAFFQYNTFTHTSDFNPGTPPPDMVYLNNCNNITFLSCSFKGNFWPGNNGSDYLCTGVVAVNSSLKMQPFAANFRPLFTGIKTGIDITNSLQTNRIPLIYSTDFNTPNGVSMSGVFMPWVMDCKFGFWFFPSLNNVDLFLNNCTGYRIEGNRLYGDYGPPGIVVKNSGTAYNEIYRNSIGRTVANVMCVQSIGRNTNAGNTTGLKILCNDLYANAGSSSGYPAGLGYEISVMQDPLSGLNGIAKLQYVDGGGFTPNLSAGNRFHNYAEPYNGLYYPNYFIDAGTNDLSQFRYGYNAATAYEQPVYTNIPSSGLINMNTNTCPVHNLGAPSTPFPFILFVSRLSAIEDKITALETKIKLTEEDDAALDYLFTTQAKLVNDMVAQYQSPSGKEVQVPDARTYLENIAKVYEQVTKGYHYRLYLASAYVDLGRHDDAITVLDNIPAQYKLSDEEQTEIKHIAELYQTLKWLHENSNDWAKMPAQLKRPVYEYEQTDPMQAGAIARALLAQYEGRRYEPEYLAPQSTRALTVSQAASKQDIIYPNPTTGQLFVPYDNEKGSLLVLTDISGKEVLRFELKDPLNRIDISKLAAGVYSATIRTKDKISYQQKIVKQ